MLALLVAAYFYFHRTPKLTDKDTIVLADFTNTTGDPVFDGTLRQGLAVQLEQSPFLSLISDERIQQELKPDGPAERFTTDCADRHGRSASGLAAQPFWTDRIAEYCAFASATAIVTSYARETNKTRKSGSERSFVVRRFLHIISTFTVIMMFRCFCFQKI